MTFWAVVSLLCRRKSHVPLYVATGNDPLGAALLLAEEVNIGASYSGLRMCERKWCSGTRVPARR